MKPTVAGLVTENDSKSSASNNDMGQDIPWHLADNITQESESLSKNFSVCQEFPDCAL